MRRRSANHGEESERTDSESDKSSNSGDQNGDDDDDSWDGENSGEDDNDDNEDDSDGDESNDEVNDGLGVRKRKRRTKRRRNMPSGGVSEVHPDGVTVKYNGVLLHLSHRSASGYQGVQRQNTLVENPWLALSPRLSTGQKEVIGYYPTALEAAVAYAEYVKALRSKNSHVCYSNATEAEGIRLHLSHASMTGYKGVREYRPPNATASRPAYRAVAPMKDSQPPKCLGYYLSSIEAAVAYQARRLAERHEAWRAEYLRKTSTTVGMRGHVMTAGRRQAMAG